MTMLLDFDFMGVALPEVTLALLALFLLLATTYTKHFKVQTSLFGALAILGLTAILVFWQSSQTQTGFNGAFVRDRFSQLNKLLILFGAAGALILSFSYVRRGKLNFSEYPVLVLLATLGMMAMVSANSLMALYLGLELQSLALYVAAALDRDNAKSSEAGLKYFVLGALASGMLLYGCSLIYGFTGSIQFAEISNYLEHNNRDLGVAFGLVFILAGMAFKVSAAPFHMWTPDVYEGSPTPVTAFFAGAPKLAAIALLTRLVLQAFQPILFDWQQILIFVSIASMGLGAFAAIGQTNIKRLLAYSSIGNMGYCLVGLAAGTKAGVVSILVFMAIYLVTTLGAFACVIAMRRRGEVVEQISDLSGLALSHKGLAFVMAMLMFSLAGIPPFLGFFGKYFVFASAIQAHLVVLAVVGMIGSVIAAFYYLRIVKLIYFDPPPLVPLDRIDGEVKLVAYGAGAAILLLSFFGQNFIEIATAAAAVLLD